MEPVCEAAGDLDDAGAADDTGGLDEAGFDEAAADDVGCDDSGSDELGADESGADASGTDASGTDESKPDDASAAELAGAADDSAGCGVTESLIHFPISSSPTSSAAPISTVSTRYAFFFSRDICFAIKSPPPVWLRNR